MFFVLSKILGLLTDPLVIVILILVFSVIFKKARKIFLTTGFVLLLFFSNPFLINQLIKKWEAPYIPMQTLQKKYTYGIVLTGMINYETSTSRVNFLRSSDRIWQTVQLYKKGFIKKILISGGSVGLIYEDTIESSYLKHFLIDIGIPGNDIITEEQSRNTYENALYSCLFLQNNSIPSSECLLITSAIHMRRAAGCFTKQGYNIDTFATDHYSTDSGNWFISGILPNINAVWEWNSLIHELLGYAMYRFSNYL
jgi:uncharacterized SAM-binding protein YcdF (DUF218 family)